MILNDSSVNVLHSSDIFNSWTDCSEIIMGGREKRWLIFIQEWLTILRKEAEEWNRIAAMQVVC